MISIQKSGDLYIGPNKTTLENLGGDVSRALAVSEPTKETVYIRSDNEVHYNQFMEVLNTLQDDGYYKLSLITEDRI